MTQNTNLNVSPYFDDFNEDKNYNKVLFKPGFPLQARELTTLQSILQNQIERFGQHFFKEGSIVIPGGTFYDDSYFAVRIDPNFLNIPVFNYTKFLVDNNIEIEGETSGVRATVVNRLTAPESTAGYDTLYVKYSKSGRDGVTKTFQDGENLITLSDVSFLNTSIGANSPFARCIISEASKTGCSFSVSEGIFFIRGYFVKVPDSTVILDQYTNLPSYRVGLLINEEIVRASSVNSDLYDNAKGFSNEAAPGADRFKISATLHKKALTDKNDLDFIELLRVENGIVRNIVTRTQYNIIADELARRTYDESGDYYVKPFSIDVRESLNDRVGNRGIYFSNQQTQNGNTPSDDILSLQVSPGKAYVRGYEVDKISTSSIDVVKPRTTKLKENASTPIRIGNYVDLENVWGSPTIGFSTSVKLLDRRCKANGEAHRDSIVVGQARVFDFNQKSISGVSTTTHEARLYDIQTHTKVSLGATIASVPNSAQIKGKYSGSVGFATAASTDTQLLVMSDVSGQFQLNEPILINGNDTGNNITEVTDWSFDDIKALNSEAGIGAGTSTFAANLLLDRRKSVFNEGIEFNFTNTSVESAGVSDFRGLVKVGDIINYHPTSGTTVYNRVSAVNQTSLTIEAVANVDGVCNGALAAQTSPTGVDILIPSIKQGDDPGFRMKLPHNYVSSINILDSSYIVRKQFINATISNSASHTFQISALSDNSDLYFEPFTEQNYTLTWSTGQKEVIRESQVTVSANSKEIEIEKLSRTGTATLTASIRRSKLSSKDKDLVRCANLIITRSNDISSGITTFTKNDGLTVSNVYGTRVQDDEISLNVPDVSRVLAIFESTDGTDPDLPSVSVSSQSDTFTNNVIVGEEFIGAISGAVGRVVSVVSGTQLQFVYENENTFEVGESFTLKTAGILATISALVKGDTNIVNNYKLDDGHREEFADYSRIVRKKGIAAPSRRLRIIYDHYTNNEGTGTIETVNSYTGLDYSSELPFIIDSWASDFLDLRPRVTAYNTSSGDSPFSFASRNFSTSTSETVVSNKSVVVDYSYYQGRVDRLYLTKDGLFEVKKGTPADRPKAPLPNDEAMEIAVISLEPYIRNATAESAVKTIPHKRFTMKDIGSLENRIKNLETYTTLSLLETDTKNLSVKDPNTGLDKFKSGFFVDNFRNHASHNLTGESKFDIDMATGELRPRSTERNVKLMFETVSTLASPSTADYRWVEDFADANVTRNGPAVTLKFDEVEFLNQPLATRTENLNPFHIALFAGTIALNPESDFWIEEVPLGSPEVFRIDSPFNAIADLLGVEDRENGGMGASYWNSHEQTWTGREVIDEEVLDSEVISQETEHMRGRGRREVTTTVLNEDILQTVKQTGIEKTFNFDLSVGQETIDLGKKVIGVDVLYNVRSRNIEVVGKRLKPNTRYYVFMENVDMTKYAVPKLLPITMVRGSFAPADIVDSTTPAGTGVAGIRFRAATANHKEGKFNDPEDVVTILPYPLPGTTLPGSYSSTSSVLNVDTAGLAMHTSPDHLGWVKQGMTLVNTQGSAECTIDELKLVSDEKGDLIFSLHIPDPTIASNPKFLTGTSTIRLTSSATNAAVLDPGESSAEANYLASGHAQNTTEQTLAIKSAHIERKQVGSDQPVTRVTQELLEDQVRTDVHDTGWYDPLAQSFLVERDRFQDGIFITGGELFFKKKDNTAPVTVQLRTMRNGTPTTTIVPFGQTQIDSSDVNLSDDGSAATNFKFETPVYLQAGYEYAIVLIAPTEKYLTFITRMGEEDLILQSVSNRQPYLGSLFKSQNSSTWTPSQYEDLKFKLNKAKFVTNTPSSVIFYNTELPLGKIRKRNPVVAYSNRAAVSIASTTKTFTEGHEFLQGTNTGRLVKAAGPVSLGTTTMTLIPNTGIGLTNGTFTGIGFSALTGDGTGAQGTVTIAGNVITSINITAGGSGYAAGDSLLMNNVGAEGSGVRTVVAISTLTNYLVMDEVNNTFVDNADLTYVDGSGARSTIANANITGVVSDTFRDGYTLKFDHRNHGMHSSQNKVKIVDFASDITPTTLSANVDNDSTTLTVADGAAFATFEGTAVGAGQTGYLKVDKEIISYNSISGNDITINTRAIDSSLKSNHAANAFVHKYEFNGVSLRKINGEHDIDPREKTFDSYHVRIVDNSKSFNVTKSGGGDVLQVSQNVPFEVIDPRISTITPTGTSIASRIKSVSGTSMSGNEASFIDKGYETVALNKLNYLDTPRIVASKVNEFGILKNQKSFALEMTLTTDKEDVSPVVDLETANIIAMSNLVDQPISDDNWVTDSRPRISGMDPNNGIYETKKIALEFTSNSLYVQFDGNREKEANIRAFYKLYRLDGSESTSYIPFNTNGLPDKEVNSNNNRREFSEYKFTAENTPQFNAFMIKIIMTSTNQATPPRIKNFRSIALRSFKIDG